MARQFEKILAAPLAFSFLILFISGTLDCPQGQTTVGSTREIELPSPDTGGSIPLEATLKKRRSSRIYLDEQVSLEALTQILWSGQGITDKRGYRTTPSAGALYPLNIHIVVGNVKGLESGIYQYIPLKHSITLKIEGDYREALCQASLRQIAVCHAPVVLVITGIAEKTTVKYGKRGMRYIFMEAGHAAQNISLQATALNLDTVTIGAFTDTEIAKILRLEIKESPLYIIPVGKPKE